MNIFKFFKRREKKEEILPKIEEKFTIQIIEEPVILVEEKKEEVKIKPIPKKKITEPKLKVTEKKEIKIKHVPNKKVTDKKK